MGGEGGGMFGGGSDMAAGAEGASGGGFGGGFAAPEGGNFFQSPGMQYIGSSLSSLGSSGSGGGQMPTFQTSGLSGGSTIGGNGQYPSTLIPTQQPDLAALLRLLGL